MRMVRAAETGTLQADDYEVEVDGRRLNFEARIVHSGSDEVVCIIRNISDRKQAEERARQLQLELIHVARLSTMGEMASGIAHELNQPLTAIRNYAAACEESLRGLPAGVRDPVLEWVREIGDQANRAGEIIRRMRNLVSKRRPQRTRANVPEIIREVVGLFQSELRKRDIQIRLRLDEKLPPVEADPIQLQQVLLNLLRNAAEAFRPTPPTDFRITVRTRRRDGDQVEVSVADTGAGLSDEASEQAFEPFFTTKPDGMGIGLSISRSIIEAHGGRLWAESNPRGGSIFRFALPMAPPHVLGDDSPSP
jgi:C4-dicarboxylate-specific signal transduction histidine kinase